MAKPIAKLVALLTPKRRWAQFSLATMFVVVTTLCIMCAWSAIQVNRARRQRDVVASVEALAGWVGYAEPDQEALPKQFLRRWLPRDYFDEVREVNLNGTQITDAGLAHLRGLTGLQELYLEATKVTNTGLSHLQGLTALQRLHLNVTHVTSAGLAHLQRLTALQALLLDGTQVTDAGLVHLQGLTRLQWLSLSGTPVTDAGLADLHGLTGLQELYLDGTQVTDGGLAQIRQALPKCQIFGP